MLWIFLGGGTGALARFTLQYLLPAGHPSWDMTLWCINIAGAFGLATCQQLFSRHKPWLKDLLGTGFFGGFTTFSALMLCAYLPVYTNVGAQGLPLALGYLLFTFLSGLAAALAGLKLSHQLARRAESAGQ